MNTQNKLQRQENIRINPHFLVITIKHEDKSYPQQKARTTRTSTST